MQSANAYLRDRRRGGALVDHLVEVVDLDDLVGVVQPPSYDARKAAARAGALQAVVMAAATLMVVLPLLLKSDAGVAERITAQQSLPGFLLTARIRFL